MKTRVLFLVTEDWYFVSHRIGFARKLIDEGYEVSVGCRVSDRKDEIEKAGIRVMDIPFARERVSPLAVLNACWAVRKMIRQYKPDLVHAVALRSIIVAWMATLAMKRPTILNAVTGQGSLFSSRKLNLKLSLARRVVTVLFKFVFRHAQAHTVWQNEDDFGSFTAEGIAPRNQSSLIRGAGVEFAGVEIVAEPKAEVPIVLFVGRLLRDKGIEELVNAAEILRSKGFSHVLRIVGSGDSCNPKSVSPEEIESWKGPGVEILGRRSDILRQMQEANLVVMPSYREGLPKVLLEAGLAERAVVTCDVAGCREVVKHGENGVLVPAQDAVALSVAMEDLLSNEQLRKQYASANYKRVKTLFSSEVVNREMLSLYRRLLEGGRGESRLIQCP